MIAQSSSYDLPSTRCSGGFDGEYIRDPTMDFGYSARPTRLDVLTVFLRLPFPFSIF